MTHEDGGQPSSFVSEADEVVLVAALLSVTNSDPELIDRIQPEWLQGWRATIWEKARTVATQGKNPTPRNILALTDKDDTVARQEVDKLRGHAFPATRIREAEYQVAELARMRQLETALRTGLERLRVADSYSQALEAAHTELNQLDGSQVPTAVKPFSQVWDEWDTTMSTPTEHVQAIPTPWPDLNDKLAGGLHRGRTYVIGGRPGEGKSIAGVNLASHAAENGHRAVVFSVEMGQHEVASRIIASGARAEYKQITRRDVDDFNWSRIAEWGDEYRSMPLHLVDKPDIGVEYVAAVCKSLQRAHGDLSVVFVDYLQLLKPSGTRVPRQEQIAHMSRALKVLAMELGVAVVIACQLNRNAANEKRAPVLADLRESGAIEQDCDVAVLLNHPRNDDGEHTGDVHLVIAKNRTGALGTVVGRWAAYQARIGA